MSKPQDFDVLDPFRTLAPSVPGMTRSEERDVIAEQLLREDLIEDVLRGEGDLNDLLDCLSDHQIDPDYWLGQVCQNMETVINEGITFTQNERGLFLPNH